MDLFVMVSIVLSFATLVTTHVALAAGLFRRRIWWHAPFALVLVPLAPYWGYQEGMRRRAATWVVALVVYTVALLVGHVAS